MNKPICRRCLGYIPNSTNPGHHPGAISRTDNKTEICSSCGEQEALEQVFGTGLRPRSAWPA